MKRVLSGGAILLVSVLVAEPANADSWTEGFADGHAYNRVISRGDRVRNGRGAYAGRSNLGVMTSDGADERPVVRSRRAARKASTGNAARTARSTRTRAARQASAAGSASVAGSGGASGIASYYWQPQRVASGGWFNPNAMTAAHKTLPFGTKVRVTNVGNGRSAVVTINDRGPYIAGRIIDLSRAAAGSVGMIGSGLARVRMEILGK